MVNFQAIGKAARHAVKTIKKINNEIDKGLRKLDAEVHKGFDKIKAGYETEKASEADTKNEEVVVHPVGEKSDFGSDES